MNNQINKLAEELISLMPEQEQLDSDRDKEIRGYIDGLQAGRMSADETRELLGDVIITDKIKAIGSDMEFDRKIHKIVKTIVSLIK